MARAARIRSWGVISICCLMSQDSASSNDAALLTTLFMTVFYVDLLGGSTICTTMDLGPLWRGRPAREKTTDHEIPNTVVFARGWVGNYRIIYEVHDDQLVVLVVQSGIGVH
jgi:hypothetical protein